MEVYLANGIYLLIGIIYILHLAYHPCSTHSVWVLYGSSSTTLKRHDEILSIEHIEYRIYGITVHLLHIALSLNDCSHSLLHLRWDIPLYEFLIATELCSMISSYALVEIWCLILIECIACEVEYTIIKILILKNSLISLSHFLWSSTDSVAHKHIVVEIALVHLPHIHKAEHSDDSHHHRSRHLFHLIYEEGCKANKNDEYASPTIWLEDSHADIAEVGKKRIELVGWELRQSPHLRRTDKLVEEQRWHKGKE